MASPTEKLPDSSQSPIKPEATTPPPEVEVDEASPETTASLELFQASAAVPERTSYVRPRPQHKIETMTAEERIRSLSATPFHDQLKMTFKYAEERLAKGTMDPRHQAELLAGCAPLWYGFTNELKAEVAMRAAQLVPYLNGFADPVDVLGKLMNLRNVSPQWAEMFARFTKCTHKESTDFQMMLGEDIYPKKGEGWIGDYLDAVRWNIVPTAFHFWASVGLLGAVAKYKYYIDRHVGAGLRLGQYIMLTGDRGTGKSVAMGFAEGVVKQMNNIIRPADFTEQAVGANGVTPIHYAQVRILPTKTTVEALIELMKPQMHTEHSGAGQATKTTDILIDSTGWLLLDEASSFFGKDGHQVSAKLPFLTELVERDYYTYYTKTSGPIQLVNVGLSGVWCSAPGWFKSTMTDSFFEGGFLDRVLIIHRDITQRRFPTPMAIDPVHMFHLADNLVSVAKQQTPYEMTPTAQCERYYNEWYHEQPLTQRVSSVLDQNGFEVSLPRKANQIWRLAGIFSISNRNTPYITLEDFEWARRVYDPEHSYMQDFVKGVFGDPAGDKRRTLNAFFARNGNRWHPKSALSAYLIDTTAFKGNSKHISDAIEGWTETGVLMLRQAQTKTGRKVRGEQVRLRTNDDIRESRIAALEQEV